MLRRLSIFAFTALLTSACTDDATPDGEEPILTPQCSGAPAFDTVDVSATTVAPGDMIDLTFTVSRFHFSGGDGHSHHGGHSAGGHHAGGHSAGGHHAGGHSAGGHHHAGGHGAGGHSHMGGGHGDHASGDMPTSGADGCTMGHVHLYVDDLMTNPLAMITTPSATVQIPVDMAPGDHQLLLRLHDATHRIIEPQVIETVDITVE